MVTLTTQDLMSKYPLLANYDLVRNNYYLLFVKKNSSIIYMALSLTSSVVWVFEQEAIELANMIGGERNLIGKAQIDIDSISGAQEAQHYLARIPAPSYIEWGSLSKTSTTVIDIKNTTINKVVGSALQDHLVFEDKRTAVIILYNLFLGERAPSPRKICELLDGLVKECETRNPEYTFYLYLRVQTEVRRSYLKLHKFSDPDIYFIPGELTELGISLQQNARFSNNAIRSHAAPGVPLLYVAPILLGVAAGAIYLSRSFLMCRK